MSEPDAVQRDAGHGASVTAAARPAAEPGAGPAEARSRPPLQRHRTADLRELVARASERLNGSLEVEHTTCTLARVLVPALADWSLVTLADEHDGLLSVDGWHRDPRLLPLTDRLGHEPWGDRHRHDTLARLLTTGEPLLLGADATVRVAAGLTCPDARAALVELAPRSLAVIPLRLEGRGIGVLTIGRGADRSPISEPELRAASEVVRHATRALGNARSFGRQRELAEVLQHSLLSEPVQSEHLEVVVRYVPASAAARVGGDWYDAFALPDGSTMVVVGDVSGHDTPAAAMMGQLRSLVRGIAVATRATPSRLLTQVDQALETLRLHTTATVLVARLEPATLAGPAIRVRWSNAGHPPPVLVHPDGSTELREAHDLMLGVDPSSPRSEAILTLEPGATLVMYTDGLVERRAEHLDLGVERLRAGLETCHGLGLAPTVDSVLTLLLPDEPQDDVAVLAVRPALTR